MFANTSFSEVPFSTAIYPNLMYKWVQINTSEAANWTQIQAAGVPAWGNLNTSNPTDWALINALN